MVLAIIILTRLTNSIAGEIIRFRKANTAVRIYESVLTLLPLLVNLGILYTEDTRRGMKFV